MTSVQSAEGPAHDRALKRAFLMPAVIVLLAFAIFPLLWALGISFTDIQRGGSASQNQAAESAESIGNVPFFDFSVTLRNYARMGGDERLHATIRNTLFYVVGGVVLQYVIGFGLALLLDQPLWGRNLFRVIFLMPMMMTPVAAAYTGRMLFDSSGISPLTQLIRNVSGVFGEASSIPWMTDSFWAPITIVLIDTWQWSPFIMLLLLAGMQGIPNDIYEAARVDGANAWQILTRITFPILLPISATAVLIRSLEIFKLIDVVVVTTGGGPGNATETLTMYIFETALTFGNFGYAAAISFILLISVVIFSLVFLGLVRNLAPGINQ